MTEAGWPMSRAALLATENGTRGLSLDEALGFAEVLNAVPLQLLSPPEGKSIFVTDDVGYDDGGVKSWMRFGYAFGEIVQAAKAPRLDYEVAVHARAFVDADRANDSAGIIEALGAIFAVAEREGIPTRDRSARNQKKSEN